MLFLWVKTSMSNVFFFFVIGETCYFSVKPRAIRSLTVTSMSTTSANITWSYPDHPLNYYQHAIIRFTFNVEYHSKWTRNTMTVGKHDRQLGLQKFNII